MKSAYHEKCFPQCELILRSFLSSSLFG